MAFATEGGMTAAKLAIRQLNGEKIDWQTEFADYILYGVNVFTFFLKEWYTGNLQELFFHQPENADVTRKICAVLAGYVWDKKNTFVRIHDTAIVNLANFIKTEKQQA